MYPHRIRLRGPWEYQVLPGAKVQPDAPLRGRVTMPCSIADAGLPGFSGAIRFSRRFGMPRGHDPEEHYWLLLDARAKSIQMVLNEQPFAEFIGNGQFAIETTGLLLERNLLEVSLHASTDQDGLTGETALEIRRAAYLREVKVTRDADGRLRATMQIAGKAPDGLELYLLAGRKSLGHRRLATGSDQLVELHSDESVSPETTEACLELVNGGVVWFRVECKIR